ncbi:hypothetical protein [Planococcus rifietoensis]|uniref:hypothetical protein n=1 Tax=Planococcus rifietoensis TaxID=200991 RepID=UPI00384CAE7D
MENDLQLYINVDEEGNILFDYSGKNIVATESYDFYFMVNSEVADDIHLYKVVMQGMKPKLILK